MKIEAKHSDRCFKAIQILLTLVQEVEDPDCANGPAAIRAAMDAKKLFKEELDADQVEEAAGAAPGGSKERKAQARGVRAHGEGNAIVGPAPGAGGAAPDPVTQA
jgi:hypothetical protein